MVREITQRMGHLVEPERLKTIPDAQGQFGLVPPRSRADRCPVERGSQSGPVISLFGASQPIRGGRESLLRYGGRPEGTLFLDRTVVAAKREGSSITPYGCQVNTDEGEPEGVRA